jgi:D-arabinose 1-dehydrogenase-like Zn-dependent alcohol dehydrogenase
MSFLDLAAHLLRHKHSPATRLAKVNQYTKEVLVAKMPTQKAIVVYPAAREVAIRDVPIPEPRKGWVVVQVKAVGLNPTDHKRIDRECADVGSRSGCDFAGIIHAVHETETKFKVGDRIAGFVHGG